MCLFLPSLADAQVISLGAHGGVNLATVDGSATLVKPMAGASLDIVISPPFALRVEAEYTEKGGRVAVGTTMAESDFTLGYLDVPINFRLEVGSPPFPAHVFAGTTVGALLFASQRSEAGTNDVRDQLRPVDVTLDVGGGVGYQVTPNLTVTCDVRYSFGLIDNARDGSLLAAESWKTRDVKIVLGVSYTFNPLAPAAPTMPALPVL